MDIKKINEVIANNFFDLKPQIDYGTWSEHNWRLDEDGDIDIFAFETDRHNGPRCERCGYSYCHHCQDKEDEPCVKNVPNYTNDINFWSVLEKLKEKYVVTLEIDSNGVACILGEEDPNNENRIIYTNVVEAETIPMAICLAAVKSLERY